MDLPENSVAITTIDGIEFVDLYYNKEKNMFYIKRSPKSSLYKPICWKEVCRCYTNRDGEQQHRIYRYAHLRNPRTNAKLRLGEDDWLSRREQILTPHPPEVVITKTNEQTDGIPVYVNCPHCKESLYVYSVNLPKQ